jgi:hypothetical protein
MYKAYKMQVSRAEVSALGASVSLQYDSADAAKVHTGLDLLMGGEINGTLLSVDSHVFISHSHKDESLAKGLANYLASLGVKSFIDSCVWGYSDELLRQIDNVHCLHSSGSGYSYEKRNGSTSHVHMMLATALTKMLDKCECVIFLNTPNSITAGESASDERTYSPWIYYELSMLEVLQIKEPGRWRELQENFSGKEARASVNNLRISYSVDLKKLPLLSVSHLKACGVLGRAAKASATGAGLRIEGWN